MGQSATSRDAILQLAATKSATEIAAELACSRQWISRVIADARIRKGARVYRKVPKTRRPAAAPAPEDIVLEYTIKIGRNGDVTNDVAKHGSSFTTVCRAFHQIRDEIDRQIRERRACPFNPINRPLPPEYLEG